MQWYSHASDNGYCKTLLLLEIFPRNISKRWTDEWVPKDKNSALFFSMQSFDWRKSYNKEKILKIWKKETKKRNKKNKRKRWTIVQGKRKWND